MLSTNRPNNNNIFVKCGRGKNTDVIYSTNSFTQLSQLGIALFFYAFSDCDTSAPFGQGKKKFLSTIRKQRRFKQNAEVFLSFNATSEQVADAGDAFLVSLYGGNRESQNLSDLRFQLFTRAAVKPDMNLARLPLTGDAARFHSLRTYRQVRISFLLVFLSSSDHILYTWFLILLLIWFRYRSGGVHKASFLNSSSSSAMIFCKSNTFFFFKFFKLLNRRIL